MGAARVQVLAAGLHALARVCVAVALGREGTVRREIAAALTAGQDVEDLREAILQTYLFAGFPRAINGLWVLAELGPEPQSRRGAEPPPLAQRRRRGEALCRRIYGDDYEPMMRNMRRISPDLAEWIIEEGYGKTLSNARLSARERELLVVPTLAAMETWRQLPSHVRGALRVGARSAEIAAVMRACRGLLRRTAIQRVLDLLR